MFLRLYFAIFVFNTVLNLHYKIVVICIPTLNGRYTKSIQDFHLTVPHKLTGGGDFSSYSIPHYYEHDFGKRKRKRSLEDGDVVRYAISLNNEIHHAELWPNHGFISPNVVFESRQPNAKVQKRKLRTLDGSRMCHYTGQIRGDPQSRIALSTCDGLSGYITIRKKKYFIEPLDEHIPNDHGQHLHIVYHTSPKLRTTNECGTNENWENAWKKRFIGQYQNRSNLNLSRRGLKSVHRYLEVLVVCDKKFMQHHKNRDYELYVLTVMNMVADFYHDGTSGNQMDVVVVRIMYLDKEEEEVDLVINPNADDTLASFCKWQKTVNPTDLSNPNHHDIAVLLTRYDICADNLSNCGLMGLAYVAGACTGDKCCAINEDGGLVLAIVVAHEMGHVMGCAHDKEGESSCPAQDKDESYFVMAPYVHLYTTRWSTCSRAFITSLFENDLGECLNDEPEISLYKNRDLLPGAVYDAEQQCQMAFPNSKVCHVDKDKFCEMLLCQTTPTQCMSDDEPPADGTKCGENMDFNALALSGLSYHKGCKRGLASAYDCTHIRKKCVPSGRRPEAVNGGWGEWGSWSQCSRTCGGGVAMSERDCNNPTPRNKGRYCLGDRKRVKICNSKPCQPGSPSFRDIQCKEHDSKPFEGKMYTWKGYIYPDEPCVLYCLNNNNGLVKLEPRAKDGTKCKSGTRDMCISGSCRKIGCDDKVDSKAVEDVCGVCSGDGTQCNLIDEVYRGEPGHGYQKVVVIPAGSRNVEIEELKPSVNTLAISDKSEQKYFLNGQNTEQADGEVSVGDVQGVYSHPEPNRETFVIHEPLTEDIVFQVVYYGPENVGYRYKYAEPTFDSSYEPKYHWEQLDWDECSVRCSGGIQDPIFSCVEEKAGKVSDSFCENLDKAQSTPKKCNEQPCKTKWRAGKWGKCHACKFKSGVKIREIECVRESPHPGTEDILVEDGECTETKPGTRQLCNSHKKCKSRRFTDGLPDHMMEDIWRQTSRFKKNKSNAPNTGYNKQHNKKVHKKSCTKNDKKKLKPKIKVGTIVKDTVPKEEIKLIKVPLRQSHLADNLSEAAFETMGDNVGDRIDTKNAQILTGKAAAEMLKSFQHEDENKGGHNRTKS